MDYEKPTNIPIPQESSNVPTLLQERKWFGTDIRGLLLDFTLPYTPPKWTLSHNGVSFAKRGDLHIVGGKSGHGKTNFMSQIMATILCGRFGGMTCEISGEQPTVLYIDTEQSLDDTIAIKNRVCTLAGLDYSVEQPRFCVACLRETTKAEDRYRQILQLIWDLKPTVVFLDGLLDIVNDYNDQIECSEIIRELMTVSTAMNISLWCVLHENPMTDKLVGSLGSIAERKVTEVFVIRKHKAPHNDKRFDSFPDVFFEVKQTKARGKDQKDWYFVVEDRALGWGVPVEYGLQEDEKKPELSFTTEDLKKWLTERQREIQWPASRREIQNEILIPNGITDTEELHEAIEMALKCRFLIRQDRKDMKPGQKNPRLKLNGMIIPPF